jgi:hypothetical protein
VIENNAQQLSILLNRIANSTEPTVENLYAAQLLTENIVAQIPAELKNLSDKITKIESNIRDLATAIKLIIELMKNKPEDKKNE